MDGENRKSDERDPALRVVENLYNPHSDPHCDCIGPFVGVYVMMFFPQFFFSLWDALQSVYPLPASKRILCPDNHPVEQRVSVLLCGESPNSYDCQREALVGGCLR